VSLFLGELERAMQQEGCPLCRIVRRHEIALLGFWALRALLRHRRKAPDERVREQPRSGPWAQALALLVTALLLAGLIRYLRARDWRVLVVSPDPIAFELQSLSRAARGRDRDDAWAPAARLARLERGALLDKLRRAGVRVVDWDVCEPLAQALRRVRRPGPPTGGGVR
jgi:uncharacterized protein (DUF58 family)